MTNNSRNSRIKLKQALNSLNLALQVIEFIKVSQLATTEIEKKLHNNKNGYFCESRIL